MKKFSTAMLAKSGVIAGLYVLLTFITLSFASGAIQFRPSEALTLLPLFFIESVPALFIGCIIANLISGCAVLDVVFGCLVTLVCAILTYFTGRIIKKQWLKIVVGGIFPVILNAFLLPLIWYFCYGKLDFMYELQATFLIISQSVSVYAIGVPLYFAVKRLNENNKKLKK